MIPTETREINGVVFEVRGLDLRTERVVLVRLTKAAGPALAVLAQEGKQGAAEALSKVLEWLDDAEVDFLIDTFKKVTRVQMETKEDGSEGQFVPYVEAAFKKGVSSQLEWLWFCLEHQFSGFLDDVSQKFGGLLKGIQAPAAKASP